MVKNQKIIWGIISLITGFYFIVDVTTNISKVIGWILIAIGLGVILTDLK